MSKADQEIRPTEASRAHCLVGWGLYALTAMALLDSLPREAFGSDAGRFILLIGVIASWRYSWQAVHLVRSLFYRHRRFPQWRRRADQLGAESRAPHVYVLVTSYRMAAEANLAAYRALFLEAMAYGAPATVVASVTDGGDEALLEQLFVSLYPPESLKLLLMQQAGTGKRDAMAAGLRAISRRNPPPGSVLILMDGDTVVTPGTLARSIPFFRFMPDLGALTVDNRTATTGSDWAKEWYALRMAQRHIYMCSIGLSRRLLVLTGRFSIFRAELATDPDFIAALENDAIDHWRLGRVKFLTGDDKSTWFWLLKNRWAMLYLPDVHVMCMEELPGSGFVKSSLKLMTRWFGNMLRNNGRAIALGPRAMGFFTWWCLVDQRLSIWTALSGPAFAVLISLAGRPEAIPIYLLWIMLTRFCQALVIFLHRGRLSPYNPPLLFYTQIVGSAVKVYMSFRIDRQSWTRQGVRVIQNRSVAATVNSAFTVYLTGLAVVAFLYFAAVIAQVLPLPGQDLIRANMLGSGFPQ